MSAHGAGKAYAIGLMMGLMSKGLTYDEAKWVTLHPAGKGPKASGQGNKKGVPALIDGTTGKILGGLGGKFTGKTIKQVKASSKKAKAAAAAKAKETKKAKAEAAAKTESSTAAKSKTRKGYNLDKVETVNNRSPVSSGWDDRGSNGYPYNINSGAYHELNDFNTFSDTGRAALDDFIKYTRSSAELNDRLRQDKIPESGSFFKERVKRMDAYFNEHKSKGPLSVLRGIPDQEQAQKMIKSGVFQDKGYVSTSTNIQTAEEFADTAALKDRYVFALRVPKGYGAVSLESITDHPGEQEILLQRNTKGPITHVEKVANDKGGFDYIAYVDVEKD